MNHYNDDRHTQAAVHAGESAQSRIQGLIALPPLPRRSHEMLSLLSDPELNILRLVELIEQTPSLAARIMGVAASPFFKSAMPPRHVSDAIIRLLGLNLVRDLSMSLILGQSFRVQQSARFRPMRYWRHAMLTATLARVLASAVALKDAPNPSEAYLAGLLHNLGLLALVHVAPDGMDIAFKQAEAEPMRSLIDIERALLGLDHAQAGGEIAAAWRLPAPIGAAMRHHLDSAYRGADWPLVALTNLASGVSGEQGDGEAQDADADARVQLLEVLGIRPIHWERAIQHWREQADNIDRLASVLASHRAMKTDGTPPWPDSGVLFLVDALGSLRELIAAVAGGADAAALRQALDALVEHRDFDGCAIYLEQRGSGSSRVRRPRADGGRRAVTGAGGGRRGDRGHREAHRVCAAGARSVPALGLAARQPDRAADRCCAARVGRLGGVEPRAVSLPAVARESARTPLRCPVARPRPVWHVRGCRDPSASAPCGHRVGWPGADASSTAGPPANPGVHSLDPLTGLLDRRAFESGLQDLLDGGSAARQPWYLLYLDIDRFRLIRDYGGDQAADRVIRIIADILRREAGREIALGRLGGDEFGIVVDPVSQEGALALAQRLIHIVDAQRMSHAGQPFDISISIGLASIGSGRRSGDVALRQAQDACRVARHQGGGAIQVYREADNSQRRLNDDGRMLNHLTGALKDHRLRLFAQPIVPASARATDPGTEVALYEVLLRMLDEQGNLHSAGAFLPLAERYGLSVKLDRWVIRETFSLLASSGRAALERSEFAVNLSGHSINDCGLLDFIVEQFDATGVPAERICFEITETAAISDIDSAKHFIRVLKDIGCKFALDDFGSGHSSFLYLRDLEVDYLKIDGNLVREITRDPVSLAFVRSIDDIGKIMGKRTIAEYVEDDQVLEAIVEIGVDFAQGYWVGRPEPLERWLS